MDDRVKISHIVRMVDAVPRAPWVWLLVAGLLLVAWDWISPLLAYVLGGGFLGYCIGARRMAWMRTAEGWHLGYKPGRMYPVEPKVVDRNG